MSLIRCLFKTLLIFLLFSQFTHSLELAPLYRDHAVFQRGKDISIKGWSKPNSSVELVFQQKTYESKTDSAGKWSIKINKQPASGPFTIQISSNNKQIILNDIYFGDVWLASGQSNMEWKLKWGVNNWRQEVADSNKPLIRYFDVKNDYTEHPQEKLQEAQWLKANPNISMDFSAVAWLFGKKVHQEQGVAVGIIDSTWGGTPAEAWTPTKDLLLTSSYKKEAHLLLNQSKQWTEQFETEKKASVIKWNLVQSKAGFQNKNLASPEYDDSDWAQIELPKKEKFHNIAWFRRSFNITSLPSKPNKTSLNLGITPQVVQIYINNKFIAEKTPQEKALPFQFDSKVLKQGNNLIAIRALNTWNNQFRIGKKNQLNITSNQTITSLEGKWRYSSSQEPQFPHIAGLWRKPGVLYNAMIHPLIDFPIKGVIWYQGESNIDRAEHYNELFSQLIVSWRKKWQQPTLPFLYVQLASMNPQSKHPTESPWAELREAQTQTLDLPHTGMAVAIDAGEARDIHPRNKQIIAERLWTIASSLVYQNNAIYSGPKATSIEQEGQSIIVSFDNIGKGLKAKGQLVGFELADASKKYVIANAKINGNKVVVSAKLPNSPVSVRYGWADNSPANLYNAEGLPAIPFRLGE